MLNVEQLHVRVDRSQSDPLIAGLSLAVSSGEGIGIVGPSGCGKTTLLRTIAGLIDPAGGAGGSVTFDGKTPDEWGWPMFRRHVCLVPQRPVVWDGTVCENLLRPCRFKAIRHAYGRAEAQAMLEQVGLADKLDVQATELSEGEKQRICLVRALLAEPNCLLLDEPTSALDGVAVGRVEALLLAHQQRSDGTGMLLATHDPALAERVCSRVIDLSAYTPRAKAVADA